MKGQPPEAPINARSEDQRQAAREAREKARTKRELARWERVEASWLSLGAAPALAIVAAFGLLFVALGNDAARDGETGLQPFFWIGLVVIYGPITYRLLSLGARREERIALVLTLGISLFLVKVLRSPLDYVRFDELGWWRATNDIITTGHAFGDNPLAVATAGFPGLSTLTAALSELTGLSIFHAGLILIGTARAILILALFLFLERIAGSSARAAGIGIAIYACNPSFLYFDAQFGYESLALMIGAALLLAALRWADDRQPWFEPMRAGVLGVLVPLAGMLTITHHMSSMAFLAFLILWSTIVLLEYRPSRRELLRQWDVGPLLPAALMAVCVGLWFAFVSGAVTVEELGGVFSRAFHSVADLILGQSESKQLFSGAGQNEHIAARALALGSVVPLLVLVPLGLYVMWRDRERDPLRLTLGAVAALYPVSLGLRLTLASSETSQRASEFVFVGVAFVGAMLITRWGSLGWPLRGRTRSLALTGVAVMSFLGGFIIGELAATRQPGPYLVGAEDRAVTPEGIAAAKFAAEHLEPQSRIHVDRTNATLLGSYGDVDPIFGKYGDVSIPHVLFGERFDRASRRVIHGQSLAYIVVDTRLTRELPLIGYYVESDEPQAFVRESPVTRSALEKFDAVPDVSRVYSNGPIVIYDTSALLK